MDESSRRLRRRSESGAVTAETAILLPALVVLLITGMWVVGIVLANVRCIDAARDAARAVARGETNEVAEEIGSRAAPPGAEIEINRDGQEVEVVVSAPAKLDWLLLSGLPSVEVQGRSVVQVEPGVPDLARSDVRVQPRPGARVQPRPGASALAGSGVPMARPSGSLLAWSATRADAGPGMPILAGSGAQEVLA